MKYTDSGGRVSLAVISNDRSTSVAISDNGYGISPELLPYVFEMFTTEADMPGHGLGVGLAVAQQLVELHGGTITVSSKGRGLRTEVVVTLPRWAPAAVATALMRRS